ncbi:hypothetical protein M758_11G116400 [Ceratodon purpureus]|nr:hypothetical protein M758_11G116400 [Ceratodon purpureus]
MCHCGLSMLVYMVFDLVRILINCLAGRTGTYIRLSFALPVTDMVYCILG